MKNKRKNSETSNSTFLQLLRLLGIAFVTIIVGMLIFGIVVFAASFISYQIDIAEVQQAVVEQCGIPEYEAQGYFDSSSLNVYLDEQFLSQITISCIPADFPGGDGSWQCRCRETNAP